MSDLLKQQVLSYLETHNTMTLGTCSGDVPWAATVFYASDDVRLYFFSVPDSRHCQNLAANPRVAVTVQEDYHDWQRIKGIQLEGTVILVDSIIEKAKAMAVYARKYPEVIKLFTNPASGMAATGGCIGILLGIGSSEVLKFWAQWPTLVSPTIVAIAFLFSGAVGVFFGFYPAQKAANLDPIDALRYE